MMMRLWHGRVWAGRLADFLALVSSRAVPEYTQTSGYLGCYAFQQRRGTDVEVVLGSFWNTADALERFVAADRERARHNPEHKDQLIDQVPPAEHFEVSHLHIKPGMPRMGADAGRAGFIMRQWRGRVPDAKAAAYLEFLAGSGFREYASTPGNLAVYGLRRSSGGVTEFALITLWESVAAIKRFAGEDYEKAHYYPEDKDFLLEFDPQVSHYEVVLASDPARQATAARVIL